MMRHQFVFGVEKTKDNRPISPGYAERAIDSITRFASLLFGGCTVVESQGGWFDENYTYFGERGVCLWVDTDDPQASDKAAELADAICDILDQNCVTYSQIPVTTQFLSRRSKPSA